MLKVFQKTNISNPTHVKCEYKGGGEREMLVFRKILRMYYRNDPNAKLEINEPKLETA